MANRVNAVWLHGTIRWDITEGDDYKSNIRPSKSGYWAEFEIDIVTETINKKTGDVTYYHDTPRCRTFNQEIIDQIRGLKKGSEIDIRGELQKRDYKDASGAWKKGNPVVMIQRLEVINPISDGHGGVQKQSSQDEWLKNMGAEVLYKEPHEISDAPAVPF